MLMSSASKFSGVTTIGKVYRDIIDEIRDGCVVRYYTPLDVSLTAGHSMNLLPLLTMSGYLDCSACHPSLRMPEIRLDLGANGLPTRANTPSEAQSPLSTSPEPDKEIPARRRLESSIPFTTTQI